MKRRTKGRLGIATRLGIVIQRGKLIAVGVVALSDRRGRRMRKRLL
jgi:hypothetical protein